MFRVKFQSFKYVKLFIMLDWVCPCTQHLSFTLIEYWVELNLNFCISIGLILILLSYTHTHKNCCPWLLSYESSLSSWWWISYALFNLEIDHFHSLKEVLFHTKMMHILMTFWVRALLRYKWFSSIKVWWMSMTI